MASKTKKIDKKDRKRKFKAHEDLSIFAKDWDGTGPKVKIRLPGSGGKREFLIAPGEVVAIRNKRAQRALENWVPPPIYVNGKPWFKRDKLFKATNDLENIDFDGGVTNG